MLKQYEFLNLHKLTILVPMSRHRGIIKASIQETNLIDVSYLISRDSFHLIAFIGYTNLLIPRVECLHPPRDHLGSESVIHSDSAVRFVVFNVLEAENHARQKYEYTPRVGQPRYSSASWSKTSANLYGYSTSK